MNREWKYKRTGIQGVGSGISKLGISGRDRKKWHSIA